MDTDTDVKVNSS